jgi:hypothetical protein
MVDHIWTVFCTRSVIDKGSNNISLFEVLEKISVVGEVQGGKDNKEATPVIPVNAHLVTLWARENPSVPEKGRARIIFESPSQKPLFKTNYEINLTSGLRTRTRGNISALPVPESGWYRFSVELSTGSGSWQKVASVPLEVEVELKESPK